MGTQPAGLSFINYFSREEAGSCGYCKGSSGCERHGLWAHEMTVEDYQDLINHGWRRCGKYCYKPIMNETCCPMYTIRCAAVEFNLSNSQKRILKRVNRFLATGDKGSVKVYAKDGAQVPSMDIDKAVEAERRVNSTDLPLSNLPLRNKPPEVAKANFLVESETPVPSNENKAAPQVNGPVKINSLKARHIRINRKYDKLKAVGLSDEEISKRMVEKKRYPVKKTLEDFIDCAMPVNAAHRLEVRLVRSTPRSHEFNSSYDAGFELYKRYQVIIHKDPPWKLSNRSYDQFLVNSPLEEDEEYGSYHHQYWLDGELIAVGVIDILPSCISSVYFYYNPDYAFLSLGTYGALRELHLVRSLVKNHPQLKYYYMGYYIRSCSKMRYKAAFKPSFLLCPEVNTWHPIEMAVAKLDVVKYSRLNEDPNASDDSDLFDASNIRVVYRKRLVEVGKVNSLWTKLRPLLKEYCSLVGVNCASRMIMLLD